MARWIIEKCDAEYRDEDTGRIPWAACNLDDPDHGQETFTTKAEAEAYVREQKKNPTPTAQRSKWS
jgi:hypothetical protein